MAGGAGGAGAGGAKGGAGGAAGAPGARGGAVGRYAGGSGGNAGDKGQPNGGNGGDGQGSGGTSDGGAGGGGGGGYSTVEATFGTVSLTGGTGGTGGFPGQSGIGYSGGGGGGAGGYGAIVTSNAADTNFVNLAGGAGGTGYFGGGGGGGGIGAQFTAGGVTAVNAGTITGGRGGRAVNSGALGGGGGAGVVIADGGTFTNSGMVAGATGGVGGTGGAGGDGIAGANIAVVNSGTITAGSGGASSISTGATGAGGFAIEFTGGSNSLILQSGSTITGAISIDAGTLNLAQPTDAMLANTLQGGGSVTKTGVGTLTLTGSNIFTGGTTIAAGTLDLGAATSAGTGAITYATTGGAATASLALEAAAQPAKGTVGMAGNPFGNTLANFNAMGDTLDLKGFTFNTLSTAYVTTGTSLTVIGGAGGTQTETFTLSNGALAYTAQADAAGTGTLITAVCYAGGTAIRVRRQGCHGGADVDVEVEQLVVGDLAVTASGALRPIRWIGRMDRDAATCPGLSVVRITAGAFAPGLPASDLVVSPDHHVAVDTVLVPAWALANAWTILREPVERVTFWHVELDSHDLLLAEGLAAESYLNCGNRAGFDDFSRETFDAVNGSAGPTPIARLAEAAGATPAFCLPAMHDGDQVRAIRAWLLARANMLGAATSAEPAVSLLADGVALTPTAVAGDSRSYAVPDGTTSLRLVSRSASLYEASADPAADGRRLGVRLHTLILDGAATPLARLDAHAGWHNVEAGGASPASEWRWSDGDAALPLARTLTLGFAPLDVGYPLPLASAPVLTKAGATPLMVDQASIPSW